MPVDKFGRMSDAKTKNTRVSLTYINNNYIRSDGGTPVSGSIDMRGNTLYNVSDPVNPQDVATKKYATEAGGGDSAIFENAIRDLRIERKYRHARLYFNERFGSRRRARCSHQEIRRCGQ